jgi:hypothetical protein
LTFVNLATDPALAEAEAVDKVACLWLHHERQRMMSPQAIEAKLRAMLPLERRKMMAALERNKPKFEQGY